MPFTNKNILITGGSGLIGKALTHELLKQGFRVSHLSRKPGSDPLVTTFLWNVSEGTIDENCIKGIDLIIHLAGEGVAGKRWTKNRKKEIIESRTKSIELIYQLIKNNPNKVKSIISASATGYYGDRENELLTEDSPPAHDFLGTCCTEWEKAVDKGEQLNLTILKLRTGVVLSLRGGALPTMAAPVKLGVGSALGSGKQWVPWIHCQDAIDMYLYSIQNNLTGVYNMAAPEPATNNQLVQAIARQLHKPLWVPKVPAFVLKLLLGEMSQVVLGSAKVSSEKIVKHGFKFKYPNLTGALANIYAK